MEEQLPALRDRFDADLAIVNGENAADGAGITAKLADKLLAAGADVVTLGNHTYRRGGIASYLASSERVIRPANSGAEAREVRLHCLASGDTEHIGEKEDIQAGGSR